MSLNENELQDIDDLSSLVLNDQPINGQESNSENENISVPIGWKICNDSDGPYFWHIKTGTIQRDPPELNDNEIQSLEQSTSNFNLQPDVVAQNIKDLNYTDALNLSNIRLSLPLRFNVRSLGWVEVQAEDLTREKSVKTVNRCITQLSSANGFIRKMDVNESVGRWGDGKSLFLDLDETNLRIVDAFDMTELNVQPIKNLRVWGVDKESGREFAYVARDKATCSNVCHVFRCERPAQLLASALCELCRLAITKESTEPTNKHNIHLPLDGDILKNSSFPVPMEEPKKVIHCHYLGSTQVSMPTGIEVLNGAIDVLNARIAPEKWIYVDVTIAPSTITIADHETPDVIRAECRVRFLSFLGISVKNTSLCAFIMHMALDYYVAHVFYCEPSAGFLCKTIEAACKLRFQKCLDRNGSSPSSPMDSFSNVPPSNNNKEEDYYDSLTDFHLGYTPLFFSKIKQKIAPSVSHIKSSLYASSTAVKGNMQNLKSGLVSGLSKARNSLADSNLASGATMAMSKARASLTESSIASHLSGGAANLKEKFDAANLRSKVTGTAYWLGSGVCNAGEHSKAAFKSGLGNLRDKMGFKSESAECFQCSGEKGFKELIVYDGTNIDHDDDDYNDNDVDDARRDDNCYEGGARGGGCYNDSDEAYNNSRYEDDNYCYAPDVDMR